MPDENLQNSSNFKRNLFTDTTNFIDKHIQIIRYTSYGLAAVGAIIVIRTTHAFKIFHHVKDIPEKYITNGVKLQGHVTKITPDGEIHVKHIPIFKIPWMQQSPGDQLPLTLGGVEVLTPGVDWMQQNLFSKQIWFESLTVQKYDNHDSLCCIVTAKKNFYKNMCVNEEVIKLGLGKVQHIDGLASKKYLRLSEKLLSAEVKAEKKQKGIWKRPSFYKRLKAYPGQLMVNFKDKIGSLFRHDKSGSSATKSDKT